VDSHDFCGKAMVFAQYICLHSQHGGNPVAIDELRGGSKKTQIGRSCRVLLDYLKHRVAYRAPIESVVLSLLSQRMRM
jgi:hypothetical protein